MSTRQNATVSVTPPAVSIANLSKTFAGVAALDSASLTVNAGEVHALLGVNGSGKSTLIKVLAGFHRPDEGSTILIGGQPLEAGSARASHAAGLRFIHQDLGLIDTLTVEENFTLATPGATWWLTDRSERKRVQGILDRYEVDVRASSQAADLSPTHRSIVAIIRAVEDEMPSGGVLVLDEPTAALPRDEVHHLFRIIDQLTQRGITIIYVSHRMPEILEIADSATILRDGRTAARARVADLDLDGLVQRVLGFDLTQSRDDFEESEPGKVLLSVAGLGDETLKDFSIEARAGEVVGFTGLLGSGYESVTGLIFGAIEPSTGTIRIGSEDVTGRDSRHRIGQGLAYAPADRRRFGSIGDWTVRENLTIPDPPSSGPLRWMSARRERAEADVWLTRMQAVPHDSERVFATLSGGNQQKIVIGRWLRMKAKVLALDEPTNGVDAAAKQAIHAALRRAAADGAAVLISSSDIEELVQVCDRVLVFGDGVVRRTLEHDELTDDILNAAVMTAAAA